MRRARITVFGLALVIGITLGALVDDAAAQAIGDCDTVGGGELPLITCLTTNVAPESEGGDSSSSSGDGGRGGNGIGGVATLHDLVTLSATSETSMSLSDSPTGDIHNEVTIIVEDTDETVVILNAGNPGSTGNQLMNVGAASHAINTGGNNNSADASGSGGEGGDSSGDAPATGGDSRQGDVSVVPPLPFLP